MKNIDNNDKTLAKFIDSAGYLMIHKDKGETEAKVRGSFSDPAINLAMCFEMLEQIMAQSDVDRLFKTPREAKMILWEALEVAVDSAYSKRKKMEELIHEL